MFEDKGESIYLLQGNFFIAKSLLEYYLWHREPEDLILVSCSGQIHFLCFRNDGESRGISSSKNGLKQPQQQFLGMHRGQVHECVQRPRTLSASAGSGETNAKASCIGTPEAVSSASTACVCFDYGL
jgi:hypothetical protein